MAEWRIRRAEETDRDALAEMRALLWPESSAEEHGRDVDAWLAGLDAGRLPMTMLVAEDAGGGVIGFVEVGLRSHADGCDVARPVGYIEGWFVREGFRGHGVGAALIRASEEWARGLGCKEMASDALIDNDASQQAHAALGFEVVDRCVHYRKGL